MFTPTVIVATVALLLQSDYAVAGGAHYGGVAGYGAGYGAGSYGAAGYGAGYGAGSYGAAGYGAYNGPRYHGPQAIPVVLPDGHIADTHEVAAAKGAHLVAVTKARATSHAAGYAGYYGGSYASGYGAGAHGAGYGGDYGGAGYPGGYGAGVYGAGYAGARYAGGYGGYGAGGYGGGYAGGYGGAGYGYNTPYHGPIARPVVLPSGYLADTHDVAANKAAHFGALAHAAQSHAGWAPHSSHGYY